MCIFLDRPSFVCCPLWLRGKSIDQLERHELHVGERSHEDHEKKRAALQLAHREGLSERGRRWTDNLPAASRELRDAVLDRKCTFRRLIAAGYNDPRIVQIPISRTQETELECGDTAGGVLI